MLGRSAFAQSAMFFLSNLCFHTRDKATGFHVCLQLDLFVLNYDQPCPIWTFMDTFRLFSAASLHSPKSNSIHNCLGRALKNRQGNGSFRSRIHFDQSPFSAGYFGASRLFSDGLSEKCNDHFALVDDRPIRIQHLRKCLFKEQTRAKAFYAYHVAFGGVLVYIGLLQLTY